MAETSCNYNCDPILARQGTSQGGAKPETYCIGLLWHSSPFFILSRSASSTTTRPFAITRSIHKRCKSGYIGDNELDQCDVPAPEAGTCYIQVSALDETALLQSDGCLLVHQDHVRHRHGRTLPGSSYSVSGSKYCVLEPDRGITYSQISAGCGRVVLLQSDGRLVALGGGSPCDFPELEAGVVYTEVTAGSTHTILLRSDGRVAAVGYDCDHVLVNTDGVCCGSQTIAPPQMMLQLSMGGIQSTAANRRMFACHAASGRWLGHVDVSLTIRPHQLVHQVAGVLGMSQRIVSLKLILPDGKLLHMSDTFPLLERLTTRSRSRSPTVYPLPAAT